MPYGPPKVCARPGCGQKTSARFCPAHQVQHDRQEYVRRRPTKKLYDYQWQQQSKAFIAQPEHALCEIVGRHGPGVKCNRPSTTVDHKIPHHGDPALFRDKANWQGACFDCNSWKSGRILPDEAHPRGQTEAGG